VNREELGPLEALFSEDRRARGIEIAFEPLPRASQDGRFGVDLLEVLVPSERAALDRLRVAKRRRDWLGGRLAAKRVVRRWLARSGFDLDLCEIEVARTASGAPSVSLPSAGHEAFVTIAHSGELAAAAAFGRSAGAIGLDLERVAPVDRAIDAVAFTPLELATIERAGPARDELVLTLFTAKEAVLKALGVGLSESLHSVEVSPEGGTLRARASLPGSEARDFRVEAARACGYAVALAMTL
jgi:phosphopantetheinyl transferase